MEENNIEIVENILNTERRNRRRNREVRFEVNSIYYEAVSKLLEDYKRVLKENKELKNFRRNFVDVTDKELKEANDYFSRKYTFVGDELAQHINTLLKVTSNSIPIQKVKDKIKELDERIKNLEKNSYWASYTISECIGIRRSLQELLKGGK